MANIALTRMYSTIADYWADVQTFMTSAGWTLHDAVDADNKVYKTNGSLGNYPYIYLKLTKAANGVSMILYLYWNETTHVGSVTAYYSPSYNFMYYLNTHYMGLIGNADCVSLVNYKDNNGFTVGFFDKLFYPEITTISGSVSAGDYVDLPVVDTTGFTVGQKIQIVGVNYEGRDPLIVSDVQDLTGITVVNLPRDYASGAFVGVSPCPAGASDGSAVRSRLYLLCHRLDVGTAIGISTRYTELASPISIGGMDPDLSTDFYGLVTPYGVTYSADSVIGWMDLGGMFKYYGTTATMWDVFAVLDNDKQPCQGTVTAATNTTLTDTGQTWVVNSLTGRYVVITGDIGIGQARKILSNTVDTITVVAWDINPSTLSVYRICDKVYRFWYSDLVFLQDREVL